MPHTTAIHRYRRPTAIPSCPSPGEPERISPQIEHRLFCAITMNWRGRPLETHEVVVETIAVTSKTGPRIQAMLDTNTYEKGIKITDQQMKTFEAAHLQRHDFHGQWNYTVTAPAGTSTTRPN